MTMIRVAVLGATGYTARALLKLLLRHPHLEVTTLVSRQKTAPHVASIHPSLRGRLDLVLENLAPENIKDRADFVFSCLPHGASAAVVSQLLDAGCSVVDFSADYRLDDLDTYRDWYGVDHPDADRMAPTVYGLPELYRHAIRGARLVANPGCYPTSAILPLAPLLKEKAIGADSIIIDSKSGITGAGRTPKPNLHFPECNETITAYSVGQHRHTPEIDLILSTWADLTTSVVFTPHLIPMNRGILSTTYSEPTGRIPPNNMLDLLRTAYADEPFVRVVDHLPSTQDVLDTNYCDITLLQVQGKIVTISVIDNLLKGASGAAVQNFNLMAGFDETTGLL